MRMLNLKLATLFGAMCFAAGIGHVPDVQAQVSIGGIDVAQQPLFTQSGQPPLNMLVMGKDHKIYYEAYNDASDLNGDGALDIGYKPAVLDYYGYFNSNVCYTWSTDRFVPAGATATKRCSGQWSGDFLNYVTTSRMDALRRVLYGGWRQVDSATETVLQGAYLPQDGHSWGKEYQSVARDGYDISQYAPLSIPAAGHYHLFAVTTVTGNANAYPAYQAPLFRVLKNTDKRVWNWLSIEGPVAGNKCFTATNNRVDCTSAATVAPFPGHPADRGAFGSMETNYAIPANLFGSGALATINCNGANCNPYGVDDNYLSIIAGTLRVNTATWYQFRADGDDAIDFELLNGATSVATAGCYGPRGFGACANAEKSAVVPLASNFNYTFKFRQEEAAGGDGYRLEWRTCTSALETSCAGWTVVPNSTVHGINGTTLTTYNLTPPTVAVTRDDYLVRVQSCPSSNAAFRESTCKAYPNGQYKPTGILHDYGETSRMYFGLITGSQNNNLEGGVLRRNMSSFGDEINPTTGRFRTNVNGIANSISGLRMIGGGYGGGVTDNLNSDENWNWGNGTGNCPSVGDRAINNGECRMWGNPLAEMMYESMRYYAGAAAPTVRFNAGGSAAGTTEETTLGLTRATWKDPYAAAPGGGGFLACAKPYQTVISDINPSYDGDLPNSAFTGANTATSYTPSSITSFNPATEGQAIWNAEFGGGSKSVFIGDVNNVTDGAPTAKTATSFGNIRGLSPEEPTKGGTYYSASVARFARNTDLSTAEGDQKLSTYAIALASPLPRIDFPIGDGKITLVPFAKTASGTFGGGVRKPTNTIVDFYVESIANLPGQPLNATINGGRAYAVFRINYEDVEQGNDHDMDAIVRYLISANADGTVTVTLNSEYAAGSADQNMGYVMSGSTQDGVYLDVRDTDSGVASFLPYALNTPNPLLPGACGATTPPAACATQLPVNSTRIFTPAATGVAGGAIFLSDPLWYAAKYGAPEPAANDANHDGVPDNYFLVTNPATLRTQLDRAFADILATSQPTASVATSTPRFVPGATLAYEASYNSNDWAGDIRAFNLRSDATYNGQPAVWSASAKMPAAPTRNIFTAQPSGSTYVGTPFTSAGLSTATETLLQGSLDPLIFDNGELISYLRGDKTKEVGATGCSTTDLTECPYRKRSSKLGDILNSTPAVVGVTSFGYGSILEGFDSDLAASYPPYVQAKKAIYGNNSQSPVLYVGSNDGMLHALDGSESGTGGTELFAYMPNAVLPTVSQLASPGYTHRFYVDGSPTVIDAFIGSWKSVLISSTGAGAKAVFALDVTDPRSFAASNVLWEFNSTNDADMGQFVGRPYAGITEDKKWVASFGNGYNSARQRAVLFVRDLATGASIAKVDTGVGCPSTDVGCVDGPNGLSSALIVDNDGNGAGDTIYAGDYQGNLWRFNYVGGSDGWQLANSGVPLFVARDSNGKRQSITSGVYAIANPLGGTMVIFGTGRYLNAQDADEGALSAGTRAAHETLYGIWDTSESGLPNYAIASRPTSGTDLEYADLVKQSILTYDADGYRTATRFAVDYRLPSFTSGKLGWYLDLKCATGSTCVSQLAGERVTATPQGILSDVVFNTFRPEGDTCEPGSQNSSLVLDALAGAASYTPIEPAGGYPVGSEPPGPGLLGVDTVRGPPPGEPPIVIIRPPNLGVPCLPGSDGCECTPGVDGCAACEEGDTRPACQICDPATDPTCEPAVTKCSWRSPNSGSVPPGKAIPCGRISWKQFR